MIQNRYRICNETDNTIEIYKTSTTHKNKGLAAVLFYLFKQTKVGRRKETKKPIAWKGKLKERTFQILLISC